MLNTQGVVPVRIADEVAEMLRLGGNVSEIRKKFRSASQVCEGLRIFLGEADGQVTEKRSALQALDKELSEKQTELEECKATVETLSKETGALRTEKQQLALDVDRLDERKSRLQDETNELQEQGYTPDLLGKIRSVEPRSGPRLWSDLKLASGRRQLEAEVQALKREKTTLKGEVKELRDKKEEEAKLVRSGENRLDDLRLQAEAVREAVSTVELFFKAGWSAEDLKCLKLGLDLLGIRHEPRASITRLLRALGEEKNLADLSEKVERKREELATLNEAYTRVKADSQVIQSVTVEAITEERNASAKAIAEVAEQSRVAAEDSAASFDRRTAGAMVRVEAQAQQVMGGLKAGLGKWAKLQQEIANFKDLLFPARACVFLNSIFDCNR